LALLGVRPTMVREKPERIEADSLGYEGDEISI